MYAHSVKNPDTIHLLDDSLDRYICIGSCEPTHSKATTHPEKVTCLNCLRTIMRKPAYIREEMDLYRRTARGVREEAKEKRAAGDVWNAQIKEDLASRYDSIADVLEWVMGIREVL